MRKIFFRVLTAVLISFGLASPAIGAHPMVISTNPPAGSVQNLTNIMVRFSEAVTGVDAADLLIKGVPAMSISGGTNIYTFSFSQPPAGVVQVAWAANHGISNRLSRPEAFAGGNWTYDLQGTLPTICCRGFLRREFYEDVPGNFVTNLTSDPRFQNHTPTSTGYLTSFNSPMHGDNYGVVLSGFLIPPVSGSYQFQLHSDDGSRIFLSTNDNCANAVLLVEEPACCGFRESMAVFLVAGQKYCVTAYLKEGVGDDYLELLWRGPGITNYATIPGHALAVIGDSRGKSCVVTNQPVSQTVCTGMLASFSVGVAANPGPVFYQWERACAGTFTAIHGANGPTYTIAAVTPADACEYRCYVAIPGCCTNSDAARLTVATKELTMATTEPPSLGVSVGSPAAFTTTASGTPPFSYIWQKNGVVLAGQVGPTLSFSAAMLADAGTYTVVVTGGCNSVTNTITLVVNEGERCELNCSGTDFWLTFPGNYAPDLRNLPAPGLCIRGVAGTMVNVAIPGLSFARTLPIPSGNLVTFSLPTEADLADAYDIITHKAIHVTANAPVSVHALNRVTNTSGGYLAMPTAALGVEYWVLGYSNLFVGVPDMGGSQFAIVACEPNTVVTITPSVTTGPHAAGVPYRITLQPGYAYQLRNTDDFPADFSGTRIKATAPIAVFAGHQCANVASGDQFFCDYLVEQLQPTFMWGTNFLTAPLATRLKGDTFRVLATQPGTMISINGGPLITLVSGQPWQTILTAGTRIGATQPISVMQYANSSDFDGVVNADPFMVLVPPTTQFAATQEVCTASADFANWLNIIVPAAAVTSVTVDNVPVAGGFTPIGTSGFSYAQTAVSAGPHTVRAAQPVGVTVYGWAEFDSYGWPGCLRFPIPTPVLEQPSSNTTFTNLTLRFSRQMSANVADPSNISLSGGLGVVTVGLQPDNRTIRVTTTRQTPGATYTLTFGGTNKAPVHDLLCGTNTLAGPVTVTFQTPLDSNRPPVVHIQQVPDGVVLRWDAPNCGLQATPALGQPWVDIAGASPLTLPLSQPGVVPGSAMNRFFRLCCP